MVQLSLPTNHPLFQNSKLTIGLLLDGETTNQPEYPFEGGSVDNSYVQSELNRQYQIVFDMENPNEIDDPRNKYTSGCVHPNVRISIDGKEVKSFYLPQRGRTFAKGKVEGESELRFQFKAPRMVSEGGLSGRSDVDKLGTIVIELWLAQLVREIETVTPEETRHDIVQINEKAKKGVFVSAATSFGTKTKFSGRTVHGTNLTQYPILIHTFHYKTLDFLELEGIVVDEVEVQQSVPQPVPLKREPEPTSNASKRTKTGLASNGSSESDPRSRPTVTGNSAPRGSSSRAPDLDEVVEFVGILPGKKKLIDWIDLTEDPVRPAPVTSGRRLQPSSTPKKKLNMVQFALSTEHPSFQGATISVSIQIKGDQNLSPEYPFADGSCNSFVESKVGKQYAIVFQTSNPNPPPLCDVKIIADIYIDGQRIKSSSLKHNGTKKVDYKRVDSTRVQNFVFAKPTLVDEGGLVETDAISKLGTIEVNLFLSRNIHRFQSLTPSTAKSTDPVSVHEKAKKGALLSATTAFSGIVTSNKRIQVVDRVRLANSFFITHTFHYKTSDYLEFEGIKDGPVVIDLDGDGEVTKTVKNEGESSSPTSSATALLVTADDDDEVEFVGLQPSQKKQKVIEVIDLTED
ncbi:UNVERIFIED_CONTAM: hypothetical protein HDU68_007162 [Siphonaria sp. JEL0065]|nr:hypothetical protein HDU68_007162 [Siphonaria sp. JEL0065]